jgi:hypothetical protein
LDYSWTKLNWLVTLNASENKVFQGVPISMEQTALLQVRSHPQMLISPSIASSGLITP